MPSRPEATRRGCRALRCRGQVARHQSVSRRGLAAEAQGTGSSAAPRCGSPSTPAARDRVRHRHQGQEHHHRADRAPAARRRDGAALAGNIGLPLLELLDPTAAPDYWVIELSSYQTRDRGPPGGRGRAELSPNTSTGTAARSATSRQAAPAHRWRKPRIAVLNAADPAGRAARCRTATCAGSVREPTAGTCATRHCTAAASVRHGHAPLPLPGRHNRRNLCAVLTAIEALGPGCGAIWRRHAAAFRPLPHRLQAARHARRRHMRQRFDQHHAARKPRRARCFADRRVAILVGGHDRGVDWDDSPCAMATSRPPAVVTMGQNGPRITNCLHRWPAQASFALSAADDLADALRQARAMLEDEGVVLLSPGAPSFGDLSRLRRARPPFRRSSPASTPTAISAIPGLGIA